MSAATRTGLRAAKAGLAAAVALLAGGGAQAQGPPADPIADILARPALEFGESEPVAPRAPPQRTVTTRPVFVHEADRTPDGPATPADLAYDSRLRASAAAVRAFRGPLDGGWILLSGGRELYAFQLLDRDGAVQGAWRDLRRPGALDASGFVEQVERGDAGVAFRFGTAAVTLRADGDGRWTGALEDGGSSQSIVFRRHDPAAGPSIR